MTQMISETAYRLPLMEAPSAMRSQTAERSRTLVFTLKYVSKEISLEIIVASVCAVLTVVLALAAVIAYLKRKKTNQAQ